MTTYTVSEAAIRLFPSLDGFHKEASRKLKERPLKTTVQLVPSLQGFTTELRTKLQGVRAKLPVQIVPDFDGGAGAPTFIQQLTAKLAAIKGVAKLPIKVVPNTTGFATDLRKELAKITENVTVGVELDASQKAALLAELAVVTRDRKIKVELDFSPTPKQMAALRTLRDLSDKHVRFRVDVASDDARIAALLPSLKALNRLADKHVTIKIDLDVDEARLIRVVALLDRLRSRTVNANVNSRGTGPLEKSLLKISGLLGTLGKGFAAIGAIGTAAGAAVGPIAAMASAIGSASAALALLPAAGVAAGAGIAALVIGANGIGDAFKAATQASSGAADTSKAVEAAQQRVASAERGVATAQRGAEKAQQDLNDARKDAAKRIRDMNDELRNSALDEEDAALRVEEARIRLAETLADPEASATERKRADLSYRQALAALDEQKKANNDLAHETALANQAGVEGSQEVIDAKQAVSDATQAQVDAQRELADAIKGVGDAANSGGIDKLNEAMAKLSPNAQAFVRAMRELGPMWTDARKFIQDNLFEGMDESVSRLARQQLPVLKEGLGAIASELNGGFRDSIDTLSTDAAKLDFQTTLGNTTKLFAGLREAAAPLTQVFIDLATVGSEFLGGAGGGIGEWAREFAEHIREMRDSGELAEKIRGALDTIKGFGAAIADVGGIISGVFRAASDATGSAAGGLGTVLDRVHEFVDSAQGQDTLKSFFKGVNDAVAAIMPTFLELANIVGTTIVPAFAEMLTAAGPGIEKLVKALGDGLKPIADVMGPLGEALGQAFEALAPAMEPLGELIASIVTALTPLLPLAGQIIGMLVESLAPAFTTVFEALAPVIAQVAESLQPVLETLAPIIGEVATIFADALAQAIKQLAPLLPPLMQAFGQLVAAVAPLLPPILTLAAQLIPPLVDVLGAILPVVTKVIEIFTGLVEFITPVLVPAIELVGSIVGTVFGTIADVIAGAINNLVMPVLNTLGDGIEGLGGFFEDLGGVAKTVWDNIVKWFAKGVKLVGQILQKVEIPDWVPGIGGKGLGSLGDDMVAWGEAHGAATGGYASSEGRFETRRGEGKLIRGPGTGISDSIRAMLTGGRPLAVSNGEFLSTAQAYRNGAPLLWALNDGWVPSPDLLHQMVPGFAGGGFFADVGDFGGVPARSFGDRVNEWVNKSDARETIRRLEEQAQKDEFNGRLDAAREGRMRADEIRAQIGEPPHWSGSALDQSAGIQPSTPQLAPSVTPQAPIVGSTAAEPYGLPAGTNINYGAAGFPDWVVKMGQSHNVQPSTYAGHQEDDRNEAGYAPNPQHLNRGIDWSGPVDAMHAYAEYLLSIAPTTEALEQIIWQNPASGQKIGWAGRSQDSSGSYFASDYSGHQDHVHTRQSAEFPGAGSSTTPSTPQVMPTLDTQVSPSMTGSSPQTSTSGSSPQTSTSGSSRGSTIGGILGDFLQANVDDALSTLGFSPSSGSLVGMGLSAASDAINRSGEPQPAAPPQVSPTLDAQMTPSTQPQQMTPSTQPQQAYNPSGGAEQWRPLIREALQMMGSALTNEDRTVQQVDIESGGNPKARNDWDINAQNGTPSIGLLQVIKPTFDAMVHPSLRDRGQEDPLASLTAGIGWAIHRYGGPERIWPTRAGYRFGGWVDAPGDGTTDTRTIDVANNEFVVQAVRAQRWGGLLEAVNSGQLDRAVAAVGSSAGGVAGGDFSIRIENLQTGMSRNEFDKAMRELQAQQRMRSKSYTGSRR